ncbi:TetR/AcrR family transcriptional regulator [Mycolicibacterium pulveris]|uniref:TetR/AcrR family transcriptional regulator n=1 Tax=Mycolicibacterium pulveris TaxID=36813 RepID=UPI001F352E79|nr:TetR/AcrR family transcriptional regulator [Mycolicibacterium pulveris]
MANTDMRGPKGQRTRAAILAEAARLATVEGLEGLSIGGLADAIGMSKSGLYAHFGSKVDLQLATIESARETFIAEVLLPALEAPAGVQRLRAACEAFLSHIERRVFPGGCFFAAAAAEFGTRPGAVRDAVATQHRDWIELLVRLARKAVDLGELPPDVDPVQLSFELNAVLVAANTAFILHGDAAAFERARTAVRNRLGPGGDVS